MHLRVARELFDFCHANLAYHKAQGFVRITDSIPTTGTQKIQKDAIFPNDADPRKLAGMIEPPEEARAGAPGMSDRSSRYRPAH